MYLVWLTDTRLYFNSSLSFKGENCQVKDPRYGHVYNLKPLSNKDIKVSTEEYDYYFRVCGEITESCKPGARGVSSCQVKKMDSTFRKVAGMALDQKELKVERVARAINLSHSRFCYTLVNLKFYEIKYPTSYTSCANKILCL